MFDSEDDSFRLVKTVIETCLFVMIASIRELFMGLVWFGWVSSF